MPEGEFEFGKMMGKILALHSLERARGKTCNGLDLEILLVKGLKLKRCGRGLQARRRRHFQACL